MREIILNNEVPNTGTFLYNLKYHNILKKSHFKKYLQEIVLSFIEIKDEYEMKDFIYIIFNQYSFINWCIISTLNKTNPYKFKKPTNYKNDNKLILLLERFREIIKLIINGDKEGIMNYEDELGKIFND